MKSVALLVRRGRASPTAPYRGGVNPPGQLWRLDDLRAEVKTDGSITVDGRGLLPAGGNSIGTTATLKVFATLICEPAAPFTEHSTNAAGVPLEPNGDFRIDDVLSPIPTGCVSPVVGGSAWEAVIRDGRYPNGSTACPCDILSLPSTGPPADAAGVGPSGIWLDPPHLAHPESFARRGQCGGSRWDFCTCERRDSCT